MRTCFVRGIALVAVMLALIVSAYAQQTTATITGVVTDDTGAVLPGVSIIAKHVETGRTFEFVSSSTGAYSATLLPIGAYELTFTLSRFQPLTLKGITLAVNDRIDVNGKLKVSGLAEVIQVTAETMMVQPTPAVQNLIDSRQVQELPLNNRNFVQLATLAPGVSSDLPDEVGVGLTSTVSISVNGSRCNAVNWLVDGVSNVDVGSNITLLSTPTLESIQEFRIITSSYAAEWPRSGGGIVNVVTKSGASKFSGSAYEFLRNDKLNANNWLRNQSTNADFRKPAYLRYDLSPRWRITGRYTHDLSQTRELGGLFVGMAFPGVATTDTTVPGQVLAVGVKTIFGGDAVNDLQYQRSSNAISTQYPSDNRNTRAQLGLTIPELFPENGAGLIPRVSGNGLSTITLNQPYKNNYVNSTITDNFSWQRGNHALKFGGLVTFE